MDGWVDGWMDGWVGGKAGLRIAYSNQKSHELFDHCRKFKSRHTSYTLLAFHEIKYKYKLSLFL